MKTNLLSLGLSYLVACLLGTYNISETPPIYISHVFIPFRFSYSLHYNIVYFEMYTNVQQNHTAPVSKAEVITVLFYQMLLDFRNSWFF
jgi:hypothetical protein